MHGPVLLRQRPIFLGLIVDGGYAKIFAKWGVPDTEVKTSQVNPNPGF